MGRGDALRRRVVHRATVTSKRQLTIPADLFELMGLRTGDKIQFEPSGKGNVAIKVVPQTDLLQLAGRFAGARGSAAAGEDINALRRKAYRKRATELDARLRRR